VAYGDVFEADAGRRDEDDVGLAHVLDRHRGTQLQRPFALNGVAGSRNRSNAERRRRLAARAHVPQRAGVSEDVHRTNSGGREGLLGEEDDYVDHAQSAFIPPMAESPTYDGISAIYKASVSRRTFSQERETCAVRRTS